MAYIELERADPDPQPRYSSETPFGVFIQETTNFASKATQERLIMDRVFRPPVDDIRDCTLFVRTPGNWDAHLNLHKN